MILKRQQRGIALLEAMIAVIILAVGLLGTIGLQARAYSAMNDASLRAEATIASQKAIGLMSTDVVNLGTYAMSTCASPAAPLVQWCAATIDAIPGAAVNVAVAPAADGNNTAVTVTIGWQRKAGSTGDANRSVMTAYLAASK